MELKFIYIFLTILFPYCFNLYEFSLPKTIATNGCNYFIIPFYDNSQLKILLSYSKFSVIYNLIFDENNNEIESNKSIPHTYNSKGKLKKHNNINKFIYGSHKSFFFTIELNLTNLVNDKESTNFSDIATFSDGSFIIAHSLKNKLFTEYYDSSNTLINVYDFQEKIKFTFFTLIGVSTEKYILIANYENENIIIYSIQVPSNEIISKFISDEKNIIWFIVDYLRNDSFDEIIICFGYNDKKINCGKILYYNNNDTISLSIILKINANCDLNLKNYKLSKLYSNINYSNFGIICGTENTFQFSIFSGKAFEIINNYNNIIIELNGEENKNPNLVFFPSIDFGIYFQQNNDIKFLYLEKTFCQSFTETNVSIHIKHQLEMQKYILQGILKSNEIKFIIPYYPPELTIQCNTFNYEAGQLISIKDFVTISSTTNGSYILQYFLAENKNEICEIYINFISTCDTVKCNTCDAELNCMTCNENNNYYFIENNKTKCIHKSEIEENYYIFENVIYKCNESCSQCVNNQTCLYCNQNDENDFNNYYFTEALECMTKNYALNNGYYYNEITEMFNFCSKGCRNCKEKGNEKNMKCTIYSTSKKQCIDNYYKVSNLPSECWELNYIKDKNYFFNEEEQIFDLCDSSCFGCEKNKTNCINCQSNYYKIDKYSHINSQCYNNLSEYYYLENNVYSLCYESCLTCFSKGNKIDNKCIKCKEGYEKDFFNNNNCNKKCNNYWIYDDNNIFICLNELKCPFNKPLLAGNQCVSNCNNERCKLCKEKKLYKYENKCQLECPLGYKKNELIHICLPIDDKCYFEKYNIDIPLNELNEQINYIASNYSKYYNYSENIVVFLENSKDKFSTVIYQSDNCISLLNESSKLDLLNCPDKLKKYYNLSNDYPLIVLKTDVYSNPFNTDSVGYAIYSNSGERLNFEICENEIINIKIPVTENNGGNINLARNLSQNGIDIYDINDPFFNDICFRFTSEDGKDVPLNERIKYFQNVSFCQNDCSYKEMNYTSMEAICDCNIKTNFIIEILNNSMTSDFLNMVFNANFELFKCYKNVFNKREFSNIGGWIIFIFFIIQIIFTILYCIYDIDKLYKYLFQYISSSEPSSPPKLKIINSNNNDVENNINIENNKEILNSTDFNKENISSMNPIENYNDSTQQKTTKCDINTPKIINLKKISSPNLQNIEDRDNDEYLKNAKIISVFNLAENMNKRHSNLQNQTTPKKTHNNIITTTENSNNIILNSSNDLSSKHIKTISSSSISSSKSLMNSITSYLQTQKTKNNILDESNDLNSNNSNCKNRNKDNIIERPRESLIRRRNGFSDMREIQERIITQKEEKIEDDELNEMSVEEARKLDKRNFCIFYWFLLKKHQDIINLFFNLNPLECFHIKVIAFIFQITFYYFITALFFDESYISSEIHSKGKSFQLIMLIQNEIGRCIYSSIVGIAGGFLSKNILLYTKRLEILIKTEKNQDKFIRQSIVILNGMKSFHIFFLVINYICIVIFWYYISAFCDVMYNTRINWIEGTTITFTITNLLPFISCFIIAIFRYLGKCPYFGFLYKVSQWLI